MYEETKFKLDINWKSLLIKLGILLIVVFVICFIIFFPWNNEKVSLATNVNELKKAALIYYQDNLPLKEIGDYDKVLLKDLINNELIDEQKDLEGNSCNEKESYAYLMMKADDKYILKINVECGKNTESEEFNLDNDDLGIKEDKKDKVDEIIKEENPKDNNEVIENNKEDEVIKEDKKPTDDNKIENKDNKNESNNQEEIVVSQTPVKYKHIKYGEWIEGTKTGSNIEYDTKTVRYFNYCKDGYCVEDREENANKYAGYSKTFVRSETIHVYRRVYTIISNMCCIKGFVNTGIYDAE